MEHQSIAVHAVAKTSGFWPIVKDVPEMATASAAMHLGTQHAQGAVFGDADGVLQRLIEARPAGAAVELGFGGEQRQVAAGAGKSPLAMLLQERAGPGALSALLA